MQVYVVYKWTNRDRENHAHVYGVYSSPQTAEHTLTQIVRQQINQGGGNLRSSWESGGESTSYVIDDGAEEIWYAVVARTLDAPPQFTNASSNGTVPQSVPSQLPMILAPGLGGQIQTGGPVFNSLQGLMNGGPQQIIFPSPSASLPHPFPIVSPQQPMNYVRQTPTNSYPIYENRAPSQYPVQLPYPVQQAVPQAQPISHGYTIQQLLNHNPQVLQAYSSLGLQPAASVVAREMLECDARSVTKSIIEEMVETIWENEITGEEGDFRDIYMQIPTDQDKYLYLIGRVNDDISKQPQMLKDEFAKDRQYVDAYIRLQVLDLMIRLDGAYQYRGGTDAFHNAQEAVKKLDQTHH